MPGVERAVLFHGGPIHTMVPGAETAEALLVRAGRVVAAADRGRLERVAGTGAVVRDLGGATLLPGLIDTHPHLLHYATLAAPLVALWDALDHDDIVRRLEAKADATAPGEWVMGSPVGEPHYFVRRSYRGLREGCLPDRWFLDRASSRHPIVIQAWAPVTPNVMAFNSLGLARAGITADTPDRVENVWVEKGPDGAPTGRLSGSLGNYYSTDPFNNRIWREIPFLQPALMAPATREAMADYNAQGVTAVYENHMMDPALIDIYRSIRADGGMRLRVMVAQEAESYGMPWSAPRPMEKFMGRLAEARTATELEDPFFRFNGVTFMRDGTCHPGGLRMKAPYLGPYGEPTEGLSYISDEKALAAMRFCAEHRVRLNTIAMGTRAHEENLAQLEQVAREFEVRALGWILVHAFFVEPEQARRYARLGFDMTTSLSFCWGKGELFRRRIGEQVLPDLIPLRRLLDAGMSVAGGSDWGPKCAFEQIGLALTHEFGESGRRNLGPAQRVSRLEALAMWTRDAARVIQWPEIGTLAPGKNADLAIVDRDPLRCPVDDVARTEVLETWFDGAPVHVR